MRVWILALILSFLFGVYTTNLYYGNKHDKQVSKEMVASQLEKKASATHHEEVTNKQNIETQKRDQIQTITLVRYVKDNTNTKCISSSGFVQLYNSGLRSEELAGTTSNSNAKNTK